MTRNFRGKTISTGEWVFGDLSVGSAEHGWDESRLFIIPRQPLLERIEVIPESVGQSIGRKDKQGVEIYEGDIFKIIYSDVPNGFSPLGRDRKIYEVYGVVVYRGSGFYIEHKEPVNKEIRYGHLSMFLENPKEVIGNVADNPELLEKQ